MKMKDKLDLEDFFGNQYLVLASAGNKLDIVNYILEGYHSNLPVLINNKFLHYTAHIYFRSVVIDLFALFGPPSSQNKYSFFLVNSGFNDTISEEYLSRKKIALKLIKDEKMTLSVLRNKEFAHYDFEEKNSISYSFEHIDGINKLYDTAKELVDLGGQLLDTSYDYTGNGELHSLKRLITESS